MYSKGNNFHLPTPKFSFIRYCGKIITTFIAHMWEKPADLKYVSAACLLYWYRIVTNTNDKYNSVTQTLHWHELLLVTSNNMIKFLIIKATSCTNFSNLFLEWNSTCFGQFLCPSSGVFHCIQSNGICHTGLLTAQAVSKPVWHIPLLCVQQKTPDDGQRNCPKQVEFHSKNKFEELVQLVGFIIRNLAQCTVAWTSNKIEVIKIHIINRKLFNLLKTKCRPLYLKTQPIPCC